MSGAPAPVFPPGVDGDAMMLLGVYMLQGIKSGYSPGEVFAGVAPTLQQLVSPNLPPELVLILDDGTDPAEVDRVHAGAQRALALLAGAITAGLQASIDRERNAP